METRWHRLDSAADWLAEVLAMIRQAETAAIAARGVFHVVLAGGSTPQRLYQALAMEHHDWVRWQLWLGDERCLAVDDGERNSVMVQLTLLSQVPIPGTNFHPIPAELGALKAAEVYAETIRAVGEFDLVLLGLGEDGHTASLFPGHAWGMGSDSPTVLAVFAAPKPPPERVSLSANRLSRSRRVMFLVSGAGKRTALAAWQRGAQIPAAAIAPSAGVDVFIDRDAVPQGES